MLEEIMQLPGVEPGLSSNQRRVTIPLKLLKMRLAEVFRGSIDGGVNQITEKKATPF